MKIDQAISFLIRGSDRWENTDLMRAARLFIARGFFPRVEVEGRMRRVESENGIRILLEKNYSNNLKQSGRLQWTFRFSVTRTDDPYLMFVDVMQPADSSTEMVGHLDLEAEGASAVDDADARLSAVVDLVKALFLDLGGAIAFVDREEFMDDIRQAPDAPALAWFTLVNLDRMSEFPAEAVSEAPVWRIGKEGADILEVQTTESLVRSLVDGADPTNLRLREYFQQQSVRLMRDDPPVHRR